MLYREDPQGLISISQPAHAWVSGQLARAWGNEHFGSFAPYEEVCLGAEQHDIGWLPWEGAPTLNPQTGRPHSFMEVPKSIHTSLWSNAKHLALPLGRYIALLVSLHGTGLYERHGLKHASPGEAQIVQNFLEQEYAFQQEVIVTLSQDSHYAPYTASEVITRNQKLVAIWDLLSLALCGGLESQRSIEGVPTTADEVTLTLTPVAGDPTQVTVAPWPFQQNAVTLVCEGRRLQQTFADEATMRAVLANAPWVTVTVTLRPE